MQQTILVTNQLPTGSSFALTDDMENVFIPSKVAAGRLVRPGQKVQAIVVPNMTHGHKTPWVAVLIIDDTPTQYLQPRNEALADSIIDNLLQGRATVEEIAEDLNVSVESIRSELDDLVTCGRVERMVCFDLPVEDAW